MDKLERMLFEEGVPYRRLPTQIVYYGPSGRQPVSERGSVGIGPGVGAVCSIIAHGYGSKEELLEISGLLTKEEARYDSALGHLDAENVFARIKNHFMNAPNEPGIRLKLGL